MTKKDQQAGRQMIRQVDKSKTYRQPKSPKNIQSDRDNCH